MFFEKGKILLLIYDLIKHLDAAVDSNLSWKRFSES